MTDLILDEIAVPDNLSFFYLEDTPLFQKKMLSGLADIGFKGSITVAATLKEANELLPKQKPKFILSDWNLPDGVGIDFLKTVRSDKYYDAVPFLMVTTMDDIDNILEAITHGADGYIVKPWSEKDLIDKIAFAYNKRLKET